MKKKLAEMTLPDGFTPMPFNSGYFMSFRCDGFSAEALRKKLLNEKESELCLLWIAIFASLSRAWKKAIFQTSAM